MAYLLSYTRKPIDNVYYDPRLAYSMHLALSEDGKKFEALNHNSGVLFAKAVELEDGALEPKCLTEPVIVSGEEGLYYIYAKRLDGEGIEDTSALGKCLKYSTRDFIDYEDLGLVECLEETNQVSCNFDLSELTEDETGIVGIVPWSLVEISEAVALRLRLKLTPIVNTGIDIPEVITVKDIDELDRLTFTAKYSDGTTAQKHILWDLSTIDKNVLANASATGDTTKKVFDIEGSVYAPHYDFPIAYDRADPCIGFWKGKYYFIATNDADGNHTLYIREADTIPELVNAKEYLLLDSVTYPEFGGLLWAPEFHIVNEKLCIFHAATPEPFFEEESCIMILKDGGNPCNKEDWSKPRRIERPDGSYICEAGKEITLDMTTFNWEGEDYVIWSERQFLPKDLGAWLYIAKLNPDEPYKLASMPIVLSKPDYSWGNNHTFVEEGPFALIRDDKLFITFSAAAVDTSYVVGLLSIEPGKDLLVPANWKKKGYPILTSRSVEGEFGTGHNAYVTDEYGYIWNTYHARPGVDAPRSSGIRRVHFDIDGEPVLDMTEDMDVRPEFRHVKTRLEIIGE